MSAFPRPRRDAGFTLIEVLAVLLLSGVLLSAMTVITGQWMLGWNRGAPGLQRVEMLTVALDRLTMDVQSALSMPGPAGRSQTSFVGTERSLLFIHPPIDRTAPEGLEVVFYGPGGDGVLTRKRARYDPDTRLEAAEVGGATALMRPPSRVTFAFLDEKEGWIDEWAQGRPPAAVRVTIGGPGLPTRSIALAVHAGLPAVCAAAQNWATCTAILAGLRSRGLETNSIPEPGAPGR